MTTVDLVDWRGELVDGRDERQRLMDKLRVSRERFREAHAEALQAMEVGDVLRLKEVAERERRLFEEQSRVVDALRQVLEI